MVSLIQPTARILLPTYVLFLTPCSAIPNAGPTAGDVADQAGTETGQRYLVVDLDNQVDELLRRRGPDSFLSHFGDYRPSVELRIGVGDLVSVTIWEASAGGLFSAP